MFVPAGSTPLLLLVGPGAMEVQQLLTSGAFECSVVHFPLTVLEMTIMMMKIIITIRIAIINVVEGVFLPFCLARELGSQQQL